MAYQRHSFGHTSCKQSLSGAGKDNVLQHLPVACTWEDADLWPLTGSLQHGGQRLLQCTVVRSRTQELAVRYGFPAISAPSPYWVAAVELGGGWSYDDLQAYCNQLRIPVPRVQELCLPGYSARYTGDPRSADGVVALDMQVHALHQIPLHCHVCSLLAAAVQNTNT